MTQAARSEVSRIIKAPRRAVYRACLDAAAIAAWRRPPNMRARIEAFDAREGGCYRISLTYTDAAAAPRGKSAGDTDSFDGRFVALVPDEKIVEAITFDSADPQLAGAMLMTTRLADAAAGTEVTILCENIPAAIRPEDNALGTRLALANLAALLE
jgi:uncharacterized protein YndB with AHSA1/START domain